jgi:8-oxo-dGTP diphosphatase
MLETLIKITWRKLPYQARLRVIRLTQKKFTASVVAVVYNARKEVLILDHYLRPGAGWGLPGGFLEAAEHPREAIARELFEETGLELRSIELIRVRTVRKHLEILYRAEGVGEAEVKSREIKNLGWFAVDELPEQMSETQMDLVRDLME